MLRVLFTGFVKNNVTKVKCRYKNKSEWDYPSPIQSYRVSEPFPRTTHEHQRLRDGYVMGQRSNISWFKGPIHKNLDRNFEITKKEEKPESYEVDCYLWKCFVKNSRWNQMDTNLPDYYKTHSLHSPPVQVEYPFLLHKNGRSWDKTSLRSSSHMKSCERACWSSGKWMHHIAINQKVVQPTSSVLTRMHTGCLLRLVMKLISFLPHFLLTFHWCRMGYWSYVQ